MQRTLAAYQAMLETESTMTNVIQPEKHALIHCLHSATLVVEGDDIFGGPSHVGHDEADTRIKFARMPFDLGDDPAGFCPTSRLIGGVCIGAPHFVRRPPRRCSLVRRESD